MSILKWIVAKFKKNSDVEPAKDVKEERVKPAPIEEINDHFEFALHYTFANEGVLSNDKFDRGGITKYGIILDDLKRMGWANPKASDIEKLTKEEAKKIYKLLYWDKLKLDDVAHKGVATCLFDIGVVRGTGIPPKYIKEICGSREKLNSYPPEEFITEFAERSLSGFRQIVARNPTQARFIKGWTNRANRLLTLKKVA